MGPPSPAHEAEEPTVPIRSRELLYNHRERETQTAEGVMATSQVPVQQDQKRTCSSSQVEDLNRCFQLVPHCTCVCLAACVSNLGHLLGPAAGVDFESIGAVPAGLAIRLSGWLCLNLDSNSVKQTDRNGSKRMLVTQQSPISNEIHRLVPHEESFSSGSDAAAAAVTCVTRCDLWLQ